MDVGSYLSGYTEGEGCFCVTFNRSCRHAFGWDIRPSFSISQNRDRSEILELFKTVFGCGTIRPDRSDKTLKYEVCSVADLVMKVIPHFERYPLLSSKRHDFERFVDICRMMKRGEHLTKEGFTKITRLADDMNASGKKRYPRTEIKV